MKALKIVAAALGITLPPVAAPLAAYVPAVRYPEVAAGIPPVSP